MRFPRAVLPVSNTLSQAWAYLPAVVVMLTVALASGERPDLGWLLLLPVMALQTLFNFGACLVVARATTHFRDIKSFLPYLFRLVFYGSGILYSVPATVSPDKQVFFDANPAYAFVSLARACVLEEVAFDPLIVASALLWTAAVLLGGVLYFRAGEQDYGRG